MTRDELLQLIDQAYHENWTELDLTDQGLTELPYEIRQLSNLRFLILRNNELTLFSPALSYLTRLQSLDLKGNQLKTLPSELGCLKNLQEFGLITIGW